MSINSFTEIENIKTSFVADNSNKQNYLSNLLDDFNKTYLKIDILISEIKITINRIISLFNQNNIDLKYDVNDYQYNSFNELVINNLSKLNGINREKVRVLLIKIEKRWNDINSLLNQLKIIESKQVNIIIPEADFDDELIIDLEEYRKNKNEKIRYILFKIPVGHSLNEIAEHVYGSVYFAYALYEYGCNKIFIDDILAKNNISLEELFNDKTLLNGITIQFPNALTKNENNELKKL